MIQKIFSIGPEQWLKGLSPSQYYNGGCGLYSADGVDIFYRPGRIVPGPADEIMLTSTNTHVPISGEIRCFAYKPGYAQLYGYDDTGKIYSIPIAGSTTVACTCGGSKGQGLEFYAGKLAYSQNSRIGSYDWTTWNNEGIAAAGSLTSSNYHPLKVGADKNLYIGNVNKLAKWDGAAFTADKLTLDSYYTITSLESDGFYLIIGAEGWTGGVPLGNKNIVTIFFWDMVSGQASRVWTLDGANSIYKLKYKDGFVYAFCGNIIYKCSFDSPPQKFIYKSGMEAGNSYGDIATIMKDQLYFPETNTGVINAYGAPNHDLQPALYSPMKFTITGADEDVTGMISYEPLSMIYLGTDEKRLIRLYANYKAGVSGITPIVELNRPWKISYLKVLTDELVSGDSLTLSLKPSSGGAEILQQTTFSYSADGAKTSKLLHANGTIIDKAQVTITWNTGSAFVRAIELYGEPATEHYAEC